MSKHKNTQRLTLLLGDIDPALLEEAYMTDTPEKLAKLRIQANSPRPRRRIIMTRLAVATISMVLAISMMLSVFILLRPETPGTEFPTGTPDTLAPDHPYMDPTIMEAPWKTGKLTLTSLTYQPATNTLSTGRLSFDKLTSVETVTDVATDAVTDAETQTPDIPDAPVFGQGENVQVSMMDNTKVSEYMGPDLIKTRPTEGEHISCSDVYYNIHTGEIVCMSCRVLELIKGSDLYTDAAIEVFIEEILLDEYNLWLSGVPDDLRETYEKLYSSPDARELFGKMQKPSLSKLNIDTFAHYDEHQLYVTEHIDDYNYPIVDIVEYGVNPDKCLYTLVSPLTGIPYGSYFIDLTTGTTQRIDIQLTGDKDSGYQTEHLAMHLAKRVIVLDDYQTVVVTLPYIFGSSRRKNDHGMAPNYTHDCVIVFDVPSSKGHVLFPVGGGQSIKLPANAAQVYGNVIYYQTPRGHWCFYRMDQRILYTVESDAFARVSLSAAGDAYAVMKEAHGYTFYKLEGETFTLLPTEVEDDFDILNRYVMDDNIRVDILTGETLPLWEGTPTVTAHSKDGRFMYLYFEGADHILCIDVCKAESGSIRLSDSFVTQAAEASASGAITYGLLLNETGERLLMTYCKEGIVVFDREAYKKEPASASDYDAILNCYTINGQKLNFHKRQNATTLLRLLYVQRWIHTTERKYLFGKESTGTWQQGNMELAEQLIEYLDVWGNNAEVPTDLLSDMLGDISISEFEGASLHALSQGTYDFNKFELSTKYGYNEEKRLDGFSRDHAKAAFAFFNVSYTEEQLAEMKALFRNVLDPVIKNCVLNVYRDTTVIASAMNEACIIATGMSYDEYMKSCAWIATPNQSQHFYAMTNAAGGDVRFSLWKHVEIQPLQDFIAGLNFIEGEKEITSITRIYRRFSIQYYNDRRFDVCLLWVGYDTEGKAYACIDGYYAEITLEEAEAFKAIYVGANRIAMDPYISFH
ncbi:MAG: hypothetical protein E7645_06105 [Ruminococcaceae bacterium]|nr:hypothetical protein [Oscillospiraceae bacterium]